MQIRQCANCGDSVSEMKMVRRESDGLCMYLCPLCKEKRVDLDTLETVVSKTQANCLNNGRKPLRV